MALIETRSNVWITGASGRIGRAIARELREGPYTLYTTDQEVDIADLDAVEEYADTCRPHYIINCVDFHAGRHTPEYDELKAYRVNALGPRNLAIVSEKSDASLIHISTDDIFLGNSQHVFNEFDMPKPADVFGKSKLAGESFVRELAPRHLVIRSQWVYTANPKDHLQTIAARIREGEQVSVAVNQIASPTSSRVLAHFIHKAIDLGEYGTFHASCQGICSRYEFVKRALEIMGLPTNNLIGSHDPRDAYDIELDDLMMRLTGIYTMPQWQDELEYYLTLHHLNG